MRIKIEIPKQDLKTLVLERKSAKDIGIMFHCSEITVCKRRWICQSTNLTIG
jgi:hypothetical protein